MNFETLPNDAKTIAQDFYSQCNGNLNTFVRLLDSSLPFRVALDVPVSKVLPEEVDAAVRHFKFKGGV